jgi:hypothetical protein
MVSLFYGAVINVNVEQPTETDQDMFEAAMERAWDKRNEWQNMGMVAAKHIKEKIPENPAFDFSNQIKKLAND